MSDDGRPKADAKNIVLARRARFVAAALASAGMVAGCETCKPQPCLSVAYVPPEGGPVPQPCLSVLPVPEDASSDATVDTDAADAGRADAGDAGKDAGRDAGKTTLKARDAGHARPQICLSPPFDD